MAHHRIGFMQTFGAAVEFLNRNTEALRETRAFLRILRHKFMQGRIQQADGDRSSAHGFDGLFNEALDEREQFIQRRAAFFLRVRNDHFAQIEQRLFAVLAVEHVFRAEQSDAFGAELYGLGGVFRRFRIGADLQTP